MHVLGTERAPSSKTSQEAHRLDYLRTVRDMIAARIEGRPGISAAATPEL